MSRPLATAAFLLDFTAWQLQRASLLPTDAASQERFGLADRLRRKLGLKRQDTKVTKCLPVGGHCPANRTSNGTAGLQDISQSRIQCAGENESRTSFPWHPETQLPVGSRSLAGQARKWVAKEHLWPLCRMARQPAAPLAVHAKQLPSS